MQKSNETRRQHDEENTFEEATRKIWNQRLKLCEANESETRGSNEERMEDLVKRHHVEREQLEAYLKSWHKPPVSYYNEHVFRVCVCGFVDLFVCACMCIHGYVCTSVYV